MALKLLSKQLQKLYEELPNQKLYSAGPLEDDLLHWQASIVGPEDSPFEGGQFYLRMDFTVDYPLKPPKIWFFTKVFHPNVDKDGKICADFLKGDWKPTASIAYILLAISSLLMHPNPETSINEQAGKIFLENPGEYEKLAKQCTLENALPDLQKANGAAAKS